MCHEYAGRWYVWVRVPKYKSVRVIVLSERGGLGCLGPAFLGETDARELWRLLFGVSGRARTSPIAKRWGD